ncbi:FCD domain-containing protein [Nocardia sp. NPDC004860]|uniref:FadR/GntR family transcriptional regulator n=1 Tax=Nocardia sp. NPDC004860 TaxID=3154557 RepID=UPI0033B46F1F
MQDRTSLISGLGDPTTTDNGVAIADRIASSISIGLLSVGERLPTEIELAHQFGVAVATLRKALAVLRERELVVTRRGRGGGTFVVRTPFPSPDEMRTVLAHTSIVELRDLRDEQVAVATAVARLAATRSWGESIERLTGIAENLLAANTPGARASADSRFHIELAVLAQSPRLMRAELRLQSEVTPLLWSGVVPGMSSTAAHVDHLAVIDAIRANDPDRAAGAISEHIDRGAFQLIDAKISMEATAGQTLGSDERRRA